MKQTIQVDADTLRRVLVALNGPGHYLRELQVTRGPLFHNPIDDLVEQFNEQIQLPADQKPPVDYWVYTALRTVHSNIEALCLEFGCEHGQDMAEFLRSQLEAGVG